MLRWPIIFTSSLDKISCLLPLDISTRWGLNFSDVQLVVGFRAAGGGPPRAALLRGRKNKGLGEGDSTYLFKIFFSLLTLSTAFLQKASGPGKNIISNNSMAS